MFLSPRARGGCKAENLLVTALPQGGGTVEVGKPWRWLRMGEGTELPPMLPAAALPKREMSTGVRVGWVRGDLAF